MPAGPAAPITAPARAPAEAKADDRRWCYIDRRRLIGIGAAAGEITGAGKAFDAAPRHVASGGAAFQHVDARARRHGGDDANASAIFVIFRPTQVIKLLTNAVVRAHAMNAWRLEVPAATHCHPPPLVF